MPYLIGVDEAGYGPNLGPLVVAASVWRIPQSPWQFDLYETLSESVTAAVDAGDGRLVIADSKTVYQSQGSWAALERGVFTAVRCQMSALSNPGLPPAGTTIPNPQSAIRNPQSFRSLWSLLASDSFPAMAQNPWHAAFDMPLPRHAAIDDIVIVAQRCAACLRQENVELVNLRARAVFPVEFNLRLEQCGSKGELLSRTTFELVQGLLAKLPDEAIYVICDKHGGRNRYGPLLQTVFPEVFVEIHGESRSQSVYRWGSNERRIEFRLCQGGERHLPSALASMTAKYLRELAMHAFNDFWRGHQPKLKPTAGYPVDAKRFKAEIAATQQRLNIPDEILWRAK